MARLLDIGAAAYGKYETRSLLPHQLVRRFAAATGVELGELFQPYCENPSDNRPATDNKFKLKAARRAATQALRDWFAIEVALLDKAERSGAPGLLEFSRRALPLGVHPR